MIVSALAITIRTDSAILVVLLGLRCLLDRRSSRFVLKLILAIGPALLIVASANYARYHSVFDRGYESEGFTTPLMIDLTGILFSAGKSIFGFLHR